MSTIDGYFQSIFSEQPNGGWLQEFKKYKFIQIKLLESEGNEKSQFLDASTQVSSENQNRCMQTFIVV